MVNGNITGAGNTRTNMRVLQGEGFRIRSLFLNVKFKIYVKHLDRNFKYATHNMNLKVRED